MQPQQDDEWTRQLREHAAIALHGSTPQPGALPELRFLGKNTAVADAQEIYQVGEDFVMLVSPGEFPDASEQEAAKMRAMKERLGPHAGRVVLDVRGQGRVQGRSFFIVPRCRPLPTGRMRNKIARWRLQGEVLQWMREVAVLADPPDALAQVQFTTSLQALERMQQLPRNIRDAAARFGTALACGAVQARHVPMHGDVWSANILRRPDGRFVLIDWIGSNIRGYGVYGLVRLAGSFAMARHRLAREIRWHAQALGHPELAAELHLLGALGYYARNLGEFPVDRFVHTARHCYDTFTSVTR